MVKFYVTSEKGLEDIVRTIKKGNPPDGMTKEEWIEELKKVFIDSRSNLRDVFNDWI